MSHIRTYCRIKPSGAKRADYQTTSRHLHLRVPENLREVSCSGRTQAKVNHEFKFDQLFTHQAKQNQVFDTVAVGIVKDFLEGYNGTIFAYGQTGSGKTFTVEGYGGSYEDRGIATRAITLVYEKLESRSCEEDLSVHVSYLEIYQETGFDLLSNLTRTPPSVPTFPKVSVVEGAKDSVIIRNLSTHPALTENAAQSLLLQGQANRKVAETTMNQRSSRSHAVFTIHLTARRHDGDTVVRSKLHLVDLAGSERVAKTGSEGQQLSEAKYINLSLHHLETVIVSLQQQSSSAKLRPGTAAFDRARWIKSLRPSSADVPQKDAIPCKHIPYRNSLLTMVLKDSIGGNCMTAMVATISMEQANLTESLSTCRFAQRVACITNSVRKNEQTDDKSLIRRLRVKVAALEQELFDLKTAQDTLTFDEVMGSKLTDEDKVKCASIMQAYLGGRINDPISAGVTQPAKWRECLRILKKLIIEHYARNGSSHNRSALHKPPRGTPRQLPLQPGNDQPSLMLYPHAPSGTKTSHPTQRYSGSSNASAVRTPINEARIKTSEEDCNVAPPAGHGNVMGRKRSASSTRSLREVDTGQSTGNGRVRSAVHSGKRITHSRPKSSSSTRSDIKSSALQHKAQAQPGPVSQLMSNKQKSTSMDSGLNGNHGDEGRAGSLLAHEHQLQAIKAELKGKLLSTTARVEEQRSFIRRLTQTSHKTELLAQEKEVLQHLRKRAVKMEKRMQFVEEQLATLQQHSKHHDNNKSQPYNAATRNSLAPDTGLKDSVAVTSGHHYQDVVAQEHVLNQDDFPEIKVKAGNEKTFIMSVQIQMKEAATRQKLLKFRKQLRLAQAANKVLAHQAPKQTKELASDTEENDEMICNHAAPSESSPVSCDHTAHSQPQPHRAQVDVDTHQTASPLADDRRGASEAMEATPASVSRLNTTSSITTSTRPTSAAVVSHLAERLAQQGKTCNKSEMRWSEGYSHSKYIQPWHSMVKDDITRGSAEVERSPITDPDYEKTPAMLVEPCSIQDTECRLDVEDNYVSHSINGKFAALRQELQHTLAKYRQADESSSQSGEDDVQVDNLHPTNDPVLVEGKSVSTDQYHMGDYTKAGTSGEGYKVLWKDKLKSLLQDNPHYGSKMGSDLIQTVPTKRDKADGPSSPGFEAALRKMLNTDSRSGARYDSFARKPRKKISVRMTAQYSKQQDKGGPQRETESLSQHKIHAQSSNTELWGPEVKRASVGERLTHFLSSDRGTGGAFREEKRTAELPGDNEHYESTMDEIPTNSQHFSRRIQALKSEHERQEVYMTSARQQRERIGRIRQMQSAAEVIQRSWRKYKMESH